MCLIMLHLLLAACARGAFVLFAFARPARRKRLEWSYLKGLRYLDSSVSFVVGPSPASRAFFTPVCRPQFFQIYEFDRFERRREVERGMEARWGGGRRRGDGGRGAAGSQAPPAQGRRSAVVGSGCRVQP